jgi:aminomuconate-semialdehyde/2-hydroxymuconate-6-semialdehyde dehydrogenase
MTFIPHVIDGQESESASGARFASVDPWTREPYAEVALGGAEALLADLGTAPSWPPAGPSTRARGRGWASPSAARCCTGSPTFH